MHVRLALVAAMLLFAAGCKREDYSSPKTAARTFYYGIIKNHPQIAKNAVVDATQAAVVDEAKTLVEGLLEVQSESQKRFANPANGGSAGGAEAVSSGLPQLSDLDAASEVINGDHASLVMKKPELKTMYFKKVKGEWKLDVLATFGLKADKPEEAKSMVRTLGKAVKLVAADIKNGKYKTAAEAKQALNWSMITAVAGERMKGWKFGG
jgi:hypothetical protein